MPQAFCLLATEVQALSSIAVNLKSQFSSIARPVTNPLRISAIRRRGEWGDGDRSGKIFHLPSS
ncbi:MAG: hypothetical protein ACM65L_11760 [Microcoleus sp.]